MPTCPDSTAWVRALGVARKKSFNVGVKVCTNGKRPVELLDPKRTTFGIWVCEFAWEVSVLHAGGYIEWSRKEKSAMIRSFDPERKKLRAKLPALPGLLAVPAWMPEVEAALDVSFRRDLAWVGSDLGGAAKAIRTWLVANP